MAQRSKIRFDNTAVIGAILFSLLCTGTSVSHAEGPDRFESFRRVASLGLEPLLVHVFADDSLLARIDRLPPDDVIRLDLNADDTIDALAWREGRTRVAALDEDGDLAPEATRPDRDSDCYLADVNADGGPDRLLDYTDDDGDNDPDRQDIYEITHGALAAPGVAAFIVFDLDDDNRLFHTTEYGYHANRDQWATDFDGDVCFLAATRDEQTGRWTSRYENPFCFYDHDGDGWSDEALRLEGEDLHLESLRWSFDVDGDAHEQQDRDYDFSLTARGAVRAPAALADSVLMRDGRSVRFVSWRHARDLARWGLWRSILLVWDEDDHNVASQSAEPDRERWEGIIADRFLSLQAVGGPPCGRINKRYELDSNGSGRMGLYWSDIDNRIHLVGAEVGEFKMILPSSLNSTEPVARTVRTEDQDGNGYFDTWSWSTGGADKRTRTVSFQDEAVHRLPLDGVELRAFWRRTLPDVSNRLRWDHEQIEKSIEGRKPSPVRSWWDHAKQTNHPIAVRAERSFEAQRFLRDLALWELGGGFLARDSQAADAAATCQLKLPGPQPCAVEVPTARLSQEIKRHLSPVAIAELVAADGRRISGQIEDHDGDGVVDLLYFPPLPADSGRQVTLEIGPASPIPVRESVRVDPWFGNGIAFESAEIAYRTYNGILDLFVKKQSRLIFRGSIGNYHEPQIWGLDALQIGDGPGIGGLHIWRNGRWIALYGGEAAAAQRAIATGPLRGIIEVTLKTADTEARRTFHMAEDQVVIIEEFRPIDLHGGVFAVALPPLDTQGSLDRLPGIWSYGTSIPAAGPIGLAGAVLTSCSNEIVTVRGGPALRFDGKGGEPIHLAWVAGGAVYGDSTDVQWRERASNLLVRARERWIACH